MADFISVAFNFGVPLFLLALGLFVGRHTERKHFRNIEQRERQMSDMLVTQLKSFPAAVPGDPSACLVVAEVVIATDYLKSFLAKLRNIFGGEIKSYQSLLVRARSEASLRMQEQARRQGYNAICNVRFQTADVGGNSTMRKVAMVAIIASGTAYHRVPSRT